MHEQGNISVHTENIFPIIKKSLYSDREIFLRELVSNAVDAIQKLKWLSYRDDFPGQAPEPKISIEIDKEKRHLKISDTGLGMTADEVKKYINQVAFSSAQEFVEKYKKEGDSQGIIGHFGLGFYSAFMVSSLVEIDTKSYQADSQAVHWSCDGSTRFTLSDSARTETGTTITLTITEEDHEFLEPSRIRTLLTKYCDFLPVSIEFEGGVVNQQDPLWHKSPSSLKDEDYKSFYQKLYPGEEEPLFWIHINTDYPVAVKGILYFPKVALDHDFSRKRIKLFCDRVYVTDNAEEIIPKFLVPLRGAIEVDGNDIPLNVSRSYLHNDRKVAKISEHIAKKVSDRLHSLYTDDFSRYASVWPDISFFMKYGALNSEKFYQQIKDVFLFETVNVEEGKPSFVTLDAYRERNKEKQENTIYYASDKETQRAYIDLHQSHGFEVLLLGETVDSHFVSFLERENKDLHFKRVDSELDPRLVEDKSAEIVDPATQKSQRELIEELFSANLPKEGVTVKAQALKSDAVPAMILQSEQMRRFREMATAWQRGPLDSFPASYTLVLNTSHPLVQKVQRLAADPAQASGKLPSLLCQHIYDLAMMAQKNPEPQALSAFVQRSHELLTSLVATF